MGIDRRTMLSVVVGGVLAGCMSAGSNDADSGSAEDYPTDRPAIDRVSLGHDDEHLHLSRRYTVPRDGDSFTVLEYWEVRDTSGEVVVTRERDRDVEPDTSDNPVMVDQSMWFLNMWDNGIRDGEYTAELVVEDTDGNRSDPETASITVSA